LRFSEKASFHKKRKTNIKRTDREKRMIFLDDRSFVEKGEERRKIIFVFEGMRNASKKK